jgi:hypothetical protein
MRAVVLKTPRGLKEMSKDVHKNRKIGTGACRTGAMKTGLIANTCHRILKIYSAKLSDGSATRARLHQPVYTHTWAALGRSVTTCLRVAGARARAATGGYCPRYSKARAYNIISQLCAVENIMAARPGCGASLGCCQRAQRWRFLVGTLLAPEGAMKIGRIANTCHRILKMYSAKLSDG